MTRLWRALSVAAMVAAGQSGAACAQASGGDEVELRWDLREPVTTRDLGAETDMLYNVQAPPGEMLDVEVLLPGVTVVGTYRMASTSTSVLYRETANPDAVADVMLFDRDVETVDGLVEILRRFEREWGYREEDCAEVGEFVAEATAKVDAAGGDLSAVDWGLTFAASFSGPILNGVDPHVTVRFPSGSFSTRTVLEWDPNVGFTGVRVTIGDAASAPPTSAATDATSCIP